MSRRIQAPILFGCFIHGLFSVTTAFAHDSWLVADRHAIAIDQSVNVRFMTGEVFPIGDAATQPERVASFVVAKQDRTVPVEGISADDRSLGATYSTSAPGLHIFGVALRPRMITLESEKFDRYLRDERAVDAINLRAEDRSAKDVVEQYTKFAKTVVAIGDLDSADRTFLTPLGHRLEIVPLSNPMSWQSGANPGVRVMLDGHPWPGISVSAGRENSGAHAYSFSDRTNANGEIAIPLDVPGHWFIKAHFIRKAGPLDEHQWESFWATLTFQVTGNVQAASQDTIQAVSSASITDDVRLIVAVHGELSPWAALGYRMGKRGLKELDLMPGDPRLLAIHRTPFEQPFTIIADGIQASTRATLGRLSLLIAKVDRTDLRTEFIDRAGGGGVEFRISPKLLDELMAPDASDDPGTLAIRILIQRDDELFAVIRTDSVAPPVEPTSLPTTRTADTVHQEGPNDFTNLPPEIIPINSSDHWLRPAGAAAGRIGLSKSLILACRPDRD